MPSILRVALPLPLPTLFDYAAGDTAVAPGCRVRVPFGRSLRVGIVVEHSAQTQAPDRLKPIDAVLDATPLFSRELLSSLRWAARYYQHPLGEVLFAALPGALREARTLPTPPITGWQLSAGGHAALASPSPRAGTRLRELLAALALHPLSQARARELAGAAAVRSALAREWIEPSPELPAATPSTLRILNAQQQAAVDAVAAAHEFAPFLLDGVTGSGKTEVYLAIARAALARGRQTLVLVPEIALTPQAIRRFRDGLGVDMTTLHSGLGEVERARAWLAAAHGDAPVILGTRSAIFVPLARPGAILVDEEHDASYKQHEGFRYHARDLAIVRAKALGVPIVLGSATPSLESLANVATGRYRALPLTQRAGGAQPPAIQLIDLRHQRLQHGFAVPTLHAIQACLARGEQALVFRNRRGYAPVLLCHDCGWNARCTGCDRAFTLHRREHALRCHHCDVQRAVPQACPQCASLALRPLGEGTERLEEALAAHFPGVPITRIDRDTTRGRRSREALLDSLSGPGPRLLVGTQMLAKGHDLAQLTLVVVLGVDEGLYSVDFRASERLAQLIVQVAGRAGRAQHRGEVILQTHDPGHPLLRGLLAHGYAHVAGQLLAERRAASMPPYAQLALLRAQAPSAELLDGFLRAALAAATPPVEVSLHGPLAAPLSRRAGAFHGQLLAESPQRATLHAFLPAWLDAVRALPGQRAVRWSIDVDPIDLY